jgi:hypothetical protein
MNMTAKHEHEMLSAPFKENQCACVLMLVRLHACVCVCVCVCVRVSKILSLTHARYSSPFHANALQHYITFKNLTY